jgi:hypothetical protein
MKFLLLNESVLEVRDDKFAKTISSIQNDTNNSNIWKVCEFLLSAVMVKLDINTTYNNLSVLPPDKIVFTPNDQFQKGKSSTVEMSVGRFINKIVQLNKDHDILRKLDWKEKDLEEFINTFKKVLEFDSLLDNIKVVSGDDIVKYYSAKKYYDTRRGSLGRSCMAHSPSNYFDIYSKNTEVVSMVVVGTANDKIIARALIWKVYHLDLKKWFFFLDRIYYTYQHEDGIIKDWFKNNYSDTLKYSELHRCIVPLKHCEYTAYPYLDNLSYLYKKRGLFKNIPYPVNMGNCFLSINNNLFGSSLLGNLFKYIRLQSTHGEFLDA